MEFCCNVNDLFEFHDKVIASKPQVNDFIDLSKKPKTVQMEIDFDFYKNKKVETPKNESLVIEDTKKETVETSSPLWKENHDLMIKYKYDTITDRELNVLYKNLEKFIYKIVRKNYVNENFQDVCNEIWRRIAKYKHKWDENKGVCVTTWVGKVAFNVIQTIRKNTISYKTHHLSYDGVFAYGKGGEAKEIDMEQIISENKDYSGERRMEFYEGMKSCFNEFNEMEKKIVSLCLDSDPETLVLENEERTYNRRYASASFIKKKLNLTTNQYKKYMKSIGEKYAKNREEYADDGIDFGILHRIL